MALTIEFTDKLVVVTCWCGINHAVPEDLRNHQRRQHDNGQSVTGIYCPLGHSHVPSGEGEAAKLERLLREERERAARIDAEREQAEASARAHKAAATRARNRAKHRVCPCCKRTFKQLAAHMKSKHPDFDPSKVEAASA